ncbi:MAG: NADH-quinone oxidoreductase subunit L [Deltaproteobacteria bacterium]|nr:NADH-quinone oxidoreductase subunit L [Deltaproteobacteria bacterium]
MTSHEAHQVQLGLIPLFPLLGSALAFVIGKKNKALSGWIATIAAVCSFASVFNFFRSLPEGGVFEDKLFTWFSIGGFTADFTFRFDSLTAVMCLVVTGVGSLIHLYSIGYMNEEPSKHRYFSYLNLFLFSMLLLVLGGNLLILFIGWEGVGLCSYLLIGFWFKNEAFARAGRKAFVVNRIGDAGFLIAIFLCAGIFGTIDFAELAAKFVHNTNMDLLVPIVTGIAICLFIGATGKSAQIPLFVWLPDAMAGPTPVSALIHAATMVTAGVYMMARTHFIFDMAPYAMMIVSIVAVLTAFVAGTIAITQNDIKKVLAYSTVSQLGFMFMAAGAGAYWIAVFHLVTHAFFKACLFLCSGSVIHSCHHEQDMREMGGLAKVMPITFVTYLISTIAISGIAPLSGYYSKHAILGAMEHNPNPFMAQFAEWLVLAASITAVITAFYMTRSLAMTFLGTYRGHAHPHESPLLMTIPLIVLASLASIAGFYGEDLYAYLHHVVPDNGHHFHHESMADALVHSWTAILGVLAALLLYTNLKVIPQKVSQAFPLLNKLLSNKYYIDEIYNMFVVKPLEGLAGIFFNRIDRGVVDGAVNGTGMVVEISGEVARTVQTGQIRSYLFMMVLGMLFVIGLYIVA